MGAAGLGDWAPSASALAAEPPLRLSWEKNMLTIKGPSIPGGDLVVWYLEAYCRPGSTDREWGETVIGHETTLVSTSDDARELVLKCRLADGVVVDHRITASHDEVDFRLVAHNPTDKPSLAHWAQPCIRVDRFTGFPLKQRAAEDYLPNCFIFVDGVAQRLPITPWATKARYTPGQVWCPKHVDRNDVNPRPLSPVVPSSGLTGCYSGDGKRIMAVAWEPYQEIFQGVISCIHSDFRIGGLSAGEKKQIRGKLYLVPADMPALVERYEQDFPEQVEK